LPLKCLLQWVLFGGAGSKVGALRRQQQSNKVTNGRRQTGSRRDGADTVSGMTADHDERRQTPSQQSAHTHDESPHKLAVYLAQEMTHGQEMLRHQQKRKKGLQGVFASRNRKYTRVRQEVAGDGDDARWLAQLLKANGQQRHNQNL